MDSARSARVKRPRIVCRLRVVPPHLILLQIPPSECDVSAGRLTGIDAGSAACTDNPRAKQQREN